MGMPVLVTLSSVGTTRAVNLDWMGGKPVSVQVTLGSSTGTGTYTVQTTLDDIMQTPATSVQWFNDPNATALTSGSSAYLVYTGPIAAVRINSTALSSQTITLRVLQGIGW